MTRQEYMKEYNSAYKKSYKGFIKYVYAHQVRNCLQRNHSLPLYTEEELLNWYLNNTLAMKLHAEWLQADCNSELTPSIDRIDNSKTYSFDNIEITTWKVNKERAYAQTRAGLLNNTGLLHQLRPIVQYDLLGVKVAEYISIAEATRATGIDHRGISAACNKQRVTFHGYLWRYLPDEHEILSISPDKLEKLKALAISSKGFKVKIETTNEIFYYSVKEAAEYLQMSEHNIRQIIKNKQSNRTPKLPDHIISITKEQHE